MSEDWRVRLTCDEVSRATRRSFRRRIADDLSRRTGDRVRVTSSGPRIFLYAATESDARAAVLVARVVLARHAAGADIRLEYWDVLAGGWQDPEYANMGPAADQFLQEQDRQWSAISGRAAWQVQVDLGSRREAAALARHLRLGGRPLIRRPKYLVVGANCEDDARDLAQIIRETASADAIVTVRESIRYWPFMAPTFPPMPSG